MLHTSRHALCRPTVFRAVCLTATASLLLGGSPLVGAEPTPAATSPTPAIAPEDSPKSSTIPAHRFSEVVITGAPVPRTISELAKPVTVLEGDKLLSLEAPQLGEVLAEQPGISQTYFGPGASRPVIRGLGGDNIRVLENGLGLLDASSVSPDHAVSLEPLLTRRIEVVRGPSALLYGPNAIGGVVNVITTRIPDQPMDERVSGLLHGRGNTVNLEGAGLAVLEGGYKGFAFHLDGFGRKTDNVSIPGFARSAQLRAARPLPAGETEEKGELVNTALSTQGGGAGVSYFWDGGYAGLSPSVYDTTYGLPGAPSTFIELSQRRLDLAAELNAPLPLLSTLKGRLGLVDYEHQEMELTAAEGAIVGTEFTNRGYDLRFDALHEQIGPLEGALGFESFYSDFDASGAEAFVPPTTTAVQSIFAFEELLLDPVRFQMSGRLDFASIDAAEKSGFGPADSRDFITGGASVGAVVTPVEPYAVALNVAYTQRPPNAQELFANGAHLATAQFEIGDRNLSVQESLGLEVAVRRAVGPVTGSVGGFYNRFNNFIDLIPTGEFIDTSGDHGHSHGADPILPVFQFESIPATFAGMEAEATVRVVEEKPYTVDLNFKTDYVYARNRDTGDPLPLLPPFRIGTGATLYWDAFTADVSMLWARKQTDTPEFILATDGYVMLDAGASYQVATGLATIDLFVRGVNLLDQDARVSTSPLKDVAPLPGVGALGGFRLRF